MIDCPNGDVRDVLPDYVNDRLPARERAEVETHLASCAACRDEVDLLRGLRTTLRRAPAVNVDAIAAAILPHRAPVKHGWTTGWRVAAAVVAIAVGGTSIALLRDDPGSDTDQRSTRVAAGGPSGVGATPGSAAPRATPAPDAARPELPASPSAIPTPTRELAIAAGSIGELSDGELSALVEGLESLDALPSTDVEGAEALPAEALEEPS
jgi:hypothetical protein